MVELGAQFKLFLQQLDIGLLVAIFALQPFLNEPLALPTNLHHLVEATRRRGLVHRQGFRLGDETTVDDSRSAIVVHGHLFLGKSTKTIINRLGFSINIIRPLKSEIPKGMESWY